VVEACPTVKGTARFAAGLDEPNPNAFVNEMEKEELDICGENGDYHTLVVDGPIFGKKIEIRDTRVIRREGVSFLEILNFELREK
jgi:diphthamide synthase (EF-2-diphthine--ammonia ligase)